MNATSGKVLQEVRFGLLITELDIRGSGVIWHLGAIEHTNMRERERESEKYQVVFNIK